MIEFNQSLSLLGCEWNLQLYYFLQKKYFKNNFTLYKIKIYLPNHFIISICKNANYPEKQQL